jgi:phenylacetate-CoA ligase
VDADQQGADRMTLECELPAEAGEGLTAGIAQSLRQVCQLRGEVKPLAPGSLPNDGKVIEDRRSYGA